MAAFKTVSEVVAALGQDYDGPTKKVKGSGGKEYDYISWDDTVRKLDSVFGPLGWDYEPSQVVSPVVGVYHCTVSITAHAIDDETGEVVTIKRGGVGVGIVNGDHATAHDTAIKGAESDGISRAAKKLGSAFGLNLYKKDNSGSQASYSTAPRSTSGNPFQAPSGQANGTTAAKGANVGNASDKQAYQMRKAGWSDEAIAGLSRDQVRAVMDGIFGKGPVIAPPTQAAPVAAPANPFQ